MTADEFLRRYSQLSPSIQELLDVGCSYNNAQYIVSGYVARPKPECEAQPHSDPLLDLLGRYDTRTLCIGLLSFNQEDTSLFYDRLVSQGRIPVAALEADPIVLCVDSREIIQVDHDEPSLSFQMARWATSSGAFLDACMKMAEFEAPYGRRRYDDPMWHPTVHEKEANNKAAREWALECARIAGLAPSEAGVYEARIWTY